MSLRLKSRRESLSLQEAITNDLETSMNRVVWHVTTLGKNRVQEAKAELATLEEERSKVIGQLASQLNQIDRQTIQIEAQLVGLRETISYRTIRAPISGKAFDARVAPQTVINADQSVLKLVPANRLQAKVEVMIEILVLCGLFTREASVDSFPSGEFGYIKGTVKLGSDAFLLISSLGFIVFLQPSSLRSSLFFQENKS